MAKSTLPKTRHLIKASFADMWSMRQSLLPIILIVMLPLVVLGFVTNNDQITGSYGSLATLVMNLAVIYAVVRFKTKGKNLTLNQAYYEGTTRFVPFVGVIALLALQMIPLLIGGLIYVSGSTGATVGLGLPELSLLAGLWLLIGLPSLRWLTRSVFGLYLVLNEKNSPVAAIRASAALVRGRSWLVFYRLLAAALLLFVIIIIPSLAVSSLPSQSGWGVRLATEVLQLASSLILVPFASVYGYNLLEALGGKPRTSN